MSKKQVIALSAVVALPALALVIAIVMAAVQGHGNNFSGGIWAIVSVTGLMSLILAASPLILMGLYPAEGFAAAGPAVTDDDTASQDSDDAFGESDDGADDHYDEDDGEQEFADDFEDDGEQMFDEGFDDDDFDEF